MHELVKGVIAGQERSAARLITMLENDDPLKNQLLAHLFPHTGKTYIIGITGSPGAGKSTLVDALTKEIRKDGLTVGIIAIDPSSPFSGGALLGDRIRMQEMTADPGVFIRSMGNRGSLGGLARTTKDAVRVLDAYGCGVIIVETVGVGQSELDIMHVADTTVVVLTPGAGDYIQTTKAGIMEIASIFAVNKGDLPGADQVVTEVEAMLDHSHQTWRPPVVKVSSITPAGLPQLWQSMRKHKDFLEANDSLKQERQKRLKQEITDLTELMLRELIQQKFASSPAMTAILNQVEQYQLSPYEAAAKIINLGLDLTEKGDEHSEQ